MTLTIAIPSPALKRQAWIEEWAPRFPLRSISVSQLSTYRRCPEKWRRRYLEHEWQPSSGTMIAGKAAWAAEARSYHRRLNRGELASTEAVLDWLDEEWRGQIDEEDIEWGSEEPGKLKDRTIAAARTYHQLIAPGIRPLAVERRFELRLDDLPWHVTGYIDLERLPGRRRKLRSIACDYKLAGRRISQPDADGDWQAGLYLAARRAERDPSPAFEFQLALRQATPDADVVATERSDAQLDRLLDQLLFSAAEIAFRTETGAWTGSAPGAWWCSASWCEFHSTCPFGGADVAP